MSKYTYHLECPGLDKWNRFKTGTLSYCQGFLDALRGQAPRLHYRLVRSDGKILDEVQPNDSVNIGMVAGWPTAEQYERAGLEAFSRAVQIRHNRKREAPEHLLTSIPGLPDNAWHKAAILTGLYRADTDVSTPDKWLTAQTDAAAALLTEVENLRRWKAEQLDVMRRWDAVDTVARTHPRCRVGESVSSFVLKLLEDSLDPK